MKRRGDNMMQQGKGDARCKEGDAMHEEDDDVMCEEGTTRGVVKAT
jgi:hypothetical protein